MQNKQSAHFFRTCTFCDSSWSSQKEFLSDPTIDLIGYYPNFQNIQSGFMLFRHSGPCGTTISMYVAEYLHLYDGPIYTEKLTDTFECPGYCLNPSEMRRCSLPCKYAKVREVLAQIYRERPGESFPLQAS